jgi:hypothetical protein
MASLVCFVMAITLLFGGHEIPPTVPANLGSLKELLGWLSWKFVTADPTFSSPDLDELRENDLDEYREYIAHWAGKIWFHANEMPIGADLRAFDLISLEDDFRKYVSQRGRSLFDHGLTVEEIWAAQELHSAEPMVLLLADRYAGQPSKRVGDLRHISSSESLVWILAAMCLRFNVRQPGLNVMVTNGKIGHTIAIAGLHGLTFEHPRGDLVRAGWFSFHDPWPARSLLAPERNFGVRVLEDVTRPPFWLISPSDLDKVIVGYVISVDMLPSMNEQFALLDFAQELHRGTSRPLWIEGDEPEQPFSLMLAANGGLTPTSAHSLRGLAQVRLYLHDLDGALDLFEQAFELAPDDTALFVSRSLAAFSYERLAAEWDNRVSGIP